MGVLILLATVMAHVICIALALEIPNALTHLWPGLWKTSTPVLLLAYFNVEQKLQLEED